MNVVNVLLILPAAGFLAVLLLPRSRPDAAKIAALAVSLAVFLLSLSIAAPVHGDGAELKFVTDVQWIASPDIRYHVGVDGLSVWLVILTALLTPICVLISWRYIERRVKEFYAFLLLLEVGLIGVFVAWDLFLFYVFWELSLVPMYFLIGIWGHERRIYAAVKFFLFTMAGSVLMLAAIIYLYLRAGTFDYVVLQEQMASGQLMLTTGEQLLLFLAFFLAFAIKVPLFPLHTWLPDAHVEAPSAGSVMLASVMLKMGTYGLLRFCLPMFPNAARQCAPWIIVLAIIGIIYGALVSLVQPNMKKLVAYSSVSHLGFVVLGIFTFNEIALDGAVYQMLNHGISTGALFMLVGFLYERRHSLEIADYGGVATPAPNLAAAFLITTLASIGLPLLNNFVGEFLVLQGAALVNFRWAVFAAIGVILSACYMLWMYQRAFFGETPEEVRSHVYDLRAREWAAILPLIALMLWMGIGTGAFLPPIQALNRTVLEQTKSNAEFLVKETPPRPPLRTENGAGAGRGLLNAR
ncbi:MAG: NADH-quinone oxidoreductase subunit M [Bryobacteraceae bacterium]|nr:NADH-quinone oxidoreductase subunit M [Bryobacteraceae bacterium]